MRYPLLAGESPVTQPLHQMPVVLFTSIALVAASFALGVVVVSGLGLELSSDIGRAVLGIGGFLGLLLIGAIWYYWAEAAVTITDQRLILVKGGFRSSSRTYSLGNIKNIHAEQTWIGVLLDFGDVEIELDNGDVIVLNGFGSPRLIRDQLFVLVAQLRFAS